MVPGDGRISLAVIRPSPGTIQRKEFSTQEIRSGVDEE